VLKRGSRENKRWKDKGCVWSILLHSEAPFLPDVRIKKSPIPTPFLKIAWTGDLLMDPGESNAKVWIIFLQMLLI
jgi:hypothetical protein